MATTSRDRARQRAETINQKCRGLPVNGPTLPWEYDDGGRADVVGRDEGVGDCVNRAIAIATGLPYAEVTTKIQAMARKRGRKVHKNGSARLHTSDIIDLMRTLGWRYTAVPRGTHLAPGELPDVPVLIADLKSSHLCAVVNGVIRDTWDSSKMRGQDPNAKVHNRHLVKAIWLPQKG